MALILTHDDVVALLTHEVCLEALEEAYSELGSGRAISRPRSDILSATGEPDTFYSLKSMDGVVSGMKVGAVRICSDICHWFGDGGASKRIKVPTAQGEQLVGLVLLFSTENCELIAIVSDTHLQRMRVSGSAALSVKYMAKKNASVMGLLGTGFQATTHAEAIARVRPIREIRVFSPTPGRREAFAHYMSKKLNKIAVLPVDSANDALKGAEVVVAATNSLTQVVPPEMVEWGMHITCVKATELGDGIFAKCGRIAVNTRYDGPENYIVGQGECGESRIVAMDPLDALGISKKIKRPVKIERIDWQTVPTLAQVVAGRVRGRETEEEVTAYVNNIGLGIQFAAVGAKLVEIARKKGVGKELPPEWFYQKVDHGESWRSRSG